MIGQMYVIEGLDGSGKQTQAEILFDRLKESYPERHVLKMSFPNYTSLSSGPAQMFLNGEFENYRQYSQKETKSKLDYIEKISYFYAVDRLATFMSIPEGYDKTYFELYYNHGAIIIADRYTTSNMLHQTAQFNGLVNKDVQIKNYINWLKVLEYEEFNLPRPTNVILLDIEPKVTLENINRRYNDDDTKKDILENLGMLESAASNSHYVAHLDNWSMVPVTLKGKMKSIDHIHMQIHTIVKNNITATDDANSLKKG